MDYFELLKEKLKKPTTVYNCGNDEMWESVERKEGIVFPNDYKKFINFDIRLSEKDSNIIIDSLINLESLKNYCSVYRQRVKPKDNMIKKLSIFK